MPEKHGSTWEKVDNWIQSVVDVCAFFCMRHLHVSKAYLRFALASVMVIASGSIYLSQPAPMHLLLLGTLGIIVIIDYLHAHGHLPYEPSGMSEYWRVYAVVLWLEVLLTMIALFMLSSDEGDTSAERFDKVQTFLITSSFVFYAYLNKTPRDPPPRKRRESKIVAQAVTESA